MTDQAADAVAICTLQGAQSGLLEPARARSAQRLWMRSGSGFFSIPLISTIIPCWPYICGIEQLKSDWRDK